MDGQYLISNADPMSQWHVVFSDDTDLHPTKITTAVNLAIGRGQERLQAARDNERGVLGIIASIVRWPQTLREAVGTSRPQQHVAQAVGVAGQIAVAVVATWIAAAGVQLGIWLWTVVASSI